MSESEKDPDLEAAIEDALGYLGGARKWPFVLKLSSPVQFGSETVEELVFRDGCAGDMRGIGLKFGEAPTEDQLLKIAGRMCGRQDKVIDKLSPEDSGEVRAIAMGFWLRSQPRGKKRSP